MAAPLVPEQSTLPDEELAEMLAETVHRTLEPDRAAPADTLQAVAQTFMEHLDRDAARLQEQLQQQIAL